MYAKRWLSILTLSAMLGGGATPRLAGARSIGDAVGHDVGHDVGEAVGIGLGITAGVLVLVGGTLWYYWHHRHAKADVPADPPPAS